MSGSWDAELTLVESIMILAKRGGDPAFWAENREGTLGIAIPTVAKASGFQPKVIERRARRLARTVFWFTRTTKHGTTGIPPGTTVCFLTVDGLISVLGQLPVHLFKDPNRRVQAEGLRKLSLIAWQQRGHITPDWTPVIPFLASIQVEPVRAET